MICPCCGQETGKIDPAKAIASMKLAPQARRVMEFLVSRFNVFVHRSEIANAVFSHRIDGGPDGAENQMSVIICRLRKRGILEEWDLEIAGARGATGVCLRWRK